MQQGQETQKWAAEWKWKLLNVKDSQLVKNYKLSTPNDETEICERRDS